MNLKFETLSYHQYTLVSSFCVILPSACAYLLSEFLWAYLSYFNQFEDLWGIQLGLIYLSSELPELPFFDIGAKAIDGLDLLHRHTALRGNLSALTL